VQAVIALADVCLSIGMPDYTVGFLRNAAPQVRTTSGDGALSLKSWLNCLRALLGCLLAACPPCLPDAFALSPSAPVFGRSCSVKRHGCCARVFVSSARWHRCVLLSQP
jgi:hypothetical protein